MPPVPVLCELTAADEHEGVRLDVLLARTLACTRGQARRMIEDGAAYIGGRRCTLPGQTVKAGEHIRVLPAAPDRTGIGGGDLEVLHRDADLLVVVKPAGLPTQPPPRGGDALSKRVRKLLAEEGGTPPRLGEVHRLDRDVSGLVVYGLNGVATASLAEQFRDHTARRSYLAIVRTAVPVVAQTIEEPIAERAPGVMTLDPTGMPACSHVIPLDFDEKHRLALVRVTLETGRTHQVRLHLGWALGPLVGDALYGDPLPTPAGQPPRIALHAALLQCRHPRTGEPTRWRREPAPDFWAVVGETTLQLPEHWEEAL